MSRSMHITDPAHAAQYLHDLMANAKPMTVLTGAGISTDSGIPAYRDEQGAWKSPPPMQHQEYMASHSARQRYWARSLHGWPTLYHAQPNQAHQVLATCQQLGLIGTIITQNVDGLHQRAGSGDVINLHGDANSMICMNCHRISPRLDMHQRCLEANADYAQHTAPLGPDGDALIEGDFSGFTVPDCLDCGGILKPHVVYFGDNVPRERVEAARAAIDDSAGLLVIGSSLMVFSGFRFARQAHQNQQPLVLLNLGKTRADELASARIQTPIMATLNGLEARLQGNG